MTKKSFSELYDKAEIRKAGIEPVLELAPKKLLR
jgi:hypothetical protein